MGGSPHTSYRTDKVGRAEEEGDLDALQALARCYLEKCQAPFSPEALKETTAAGNKVLLAARSVPVAAKAINRTRIQQQGEHLAKARDGHLRGLSDNHAAYLKQCVVEGVPSRARSLPNREKAKNHGSVRGHEEEMLQKAWKDA